MEGCVAENGASQRVPKVVTKVSKKIIIPRNGLYSVMLLRVVENMQV